MDAFKLKFSSPDQKQLKFYISNINSVVGQALVETLRNDHLNDEAHHSFAGSLDPTEDNPVPKSVSSIIDVDFFQTSDLSLLTRTILESDVIIYDLMKCQLDEVEFVIKALKFANYTTEKLLIVISSVMTWALINPKEKPQANDEFLTEELRSLRKTFPKYQFLLNIEEQCLQANGFKPNLRTYCLVSGVTYGNGEDILFSFFKQAWLLDPYELPVFSDGKNIIPMVHVRDLAEFVYHTIHRTPTSPYIFAIDWAENQDQKAVVQEISRNFGSGLVKPKPTIESVLDENFEIIRVNLKLKPSEIFEANSGAEGIEELPFRWWCRKGFVKCMDKVCEEFIQYRGLRTNKILISGPPASGKTFFGKQLARLYNIPHILIQEVIEQFLKLETEVAEEVRRALKELKEKMIEEEQAKIEIEKKKNKNKKGWVEPVLDVDRLVPRIPDQFLSRIFQWRLSQNDCRYRGYILDGFPRNFENAVALFAKDAEKFFQEESLTKKPVKNAGNKGGLAEEGNALIKRKLDIIVDIAPQSVILLIGGDDFLKEKAKGLGPAAVGTHWTEEHMIRRLIAYRKANEDPSRTVASFFKDNDFEVTELNVEERRPDEEMFQDLVHFIERKGPFKTYASKDQALEQDRLKEEELLRLQSQRNQEELDRERELELERARVLKQESEESEKIEQLRLAENGILDVRSQPLRQYLADCVIPFLTEGLISIYKSNPENPLDFLGDFLLKKSEEIDLEQVRKAIKRKEEEKKEEESLEK